MSEPAFDELYTPAYVERQLEKFRNRHANHWKAHIALARDLMARFAPAPPARLLDLGCSIGTFALEFAQDGYATVGLDLDAKSLEQGARLAAEMGLSPEWVQSDATRFTLNAPVHVVLCFDLFEHLSDEQLRGMMHSVREALVPGGVFLFHTFPTQYDHVFYRNNVFPLPLVPFAWLSPALFAGLTRAYARLLDGYHLLRRGKTWRQIIADTVHPNPLSREQVAGFLAGAGFTVEVMGGGVDDVNALKPGQGRVSKRFFAHQPVAMRSIWGAARRA